MKIRISTSIFILITIVFSINYLNGCVNRDDTSETHIINQKVIFGAPYEERDQLVNRAEGETFLDSKRDSWWQLATLSKTSGSVYLRFKEKDEIHRLFGSSTLTSAGLLFSADHVIYNQNHPPEMSEVTDQYISFESDWFSPRPHEDLITIKSDWYMRLRLKALGLDEWSRFQDQTNYRDPFERWAWQEIENWEVDGEDISLIKVEPKIVDRLASLPKWKLLGPGMFFDFKPPAVLTDDWFEKDGHAIQIQHNTLVGSSNRTLRVPLVSYDGVFRKFVSEPQQLSANNGTTRNYVLEFVTNTDAQAGSSGSALFLDGGLDSSWLNWAGIYSGCGGSSQPCSNVTRVAFDSPDYNSFFNRFDVKHQKARNDSRGNHGEPFRSETNDCIDGNPDSCYDECAKYCADPQHANEARCYKYDCVDPDAPTSGDYDSNHEGCVGANCGSSRDPEKVKHLSCTDNELAKTGNPSKVNAVQGLGVMGAPLQKNIASKTDTGLGGFGIICGPHSRREWSMNWDFIGVERRPHIRDLLTRLTHMYGDDEFWEAHKSEPLSFLNTSMRLTTEDKLEDGTPVDRIAPMPFQMCPPGFIMRGIEVQATGSEPSDYIVGVTALRCVDIREPSTPKKNACLDPSTQEYAEYPCRVPTSLERLSATIPYRAGITLDTNDFQYEYEDVTQQIGQAKPIGPLTTINCSEDGDGVVGFYVSRDPQAPTGFIELECMPYQ